MRKVKIINPIFPEWFRNKIWIVYEKVSVRVSEITDNLFMESVLKCVDEEDYNKLKDYCYYKSDFIWLINFCNKCILFSDEIEYINEKS